MAITVCPWVDQASTCNPPLFLSFPWRLRGEGAQFALYAQKTLTKLHFAGVFHRNNAEGKRFLVKRDPKVAISLRFLDAWVPRFYVDQWNIQESEAELVEDCQARDWRPSHNWEIQRIRTKKASYQEDC
jgi:hypothetical protein